MTPREWINILPQAFGYTMDDLRGPSRKRDIIRARWTVIAMLYHAGAGLAEIGRIINRNHTTVLNALRRCGVWQPQNKQWGVGG